MRTHCAAAWLSVALAAAAGAAQPAHVLFAAPLENETGDERYGPAADGLAQLVGAMLSHEGALALVDRESLHLLREEQQRALAGLAGDERAARQARLLKADAVLSGRLYRKDGALVVAVKAIDLATERVLAADQVSCGTTNLPAAALEMAGRLAKQMALPPPALDLSRPDATPMASLHFAEGLSRYYAGDLDEAIMHFLRTLDLDPDFAEAHLYSGDCFDRLGERDHAAVEWRAFLKRCPDHPEAARVRAALDAGDRLQVEKP